MAQSQRRTSPEIELEAPTRKKELIKPAKDRRPLVELPSQFASGEFKSTQFDEKRHWISIAGPLIIAAGLVGMLVYFAGILATILILAGVVAFLATCINAALDDTIGL
ncbi:MAG: hypothetical protein ACJ8FI_00600 [Sphingomicrobium sp.]